MPYAIQQSSSGKKWYVINSDTGRRLGTHSSRAKAKDQLKAVYANTKGK